MKSILKVGVCALAAAAGVFGGTALAQSGTGTQGYVTDTRNAVVKDPYNLCWRTGYWTPAIANCECDKALLPKEVCEPPAPRAAPTPPPAPAPAPAPVAKPAAPKVLVVTSTQLFDFDKATLTDAAKGTIDREVVARLKEFGSIKIIAIEGHTDRIGTQEYNQKLSERRAEAVKAYLVSKGVDAAKIDAIGMGKTVPQKSCPDPSKTGPIKSQKELIECLAPNRRAVIQVQGMSQ